MNDLSQDIFIFSRNFHFMGHFMRGSRNFRRRGGGGGGPGQPDKKALTFLFVCFFLVLSLFTEVKWSISKTSIIFQGSRGGGGPTFSRGGGGGVQLLIPYRNPYNL